MNIKSLISNPILIVKAIVTVLASALLGAIMALVYVGVFIWNVSFLTNPIVDNPYASGSPFTLAQVMAIFGAFGLGVCPIFVAGWTQGKECGLQWEGLD